MFKNYFFEVIARHFKWLDWSVELRSKNYVFWDWFLFLFKSFESLNGFDKRIEWNKLTALMIVSM